jgi:hypothetical protein
MELSLLILLRMMRIDPLAVVAHHLVGLLVVVVVLDFVGMRARSWNDWDSFEIRMLLLRLLILAVAAAAVCALLRPLWSAQKQQLQCALYDSICWK